MNYRRIKNETKEEQEALWAGSLGDKYNVRNESTQIYGLREKFWNREWDAQRILEIGCNKGYNLKCFDDKYDLYGIDVNTSAVSFCHTFLPWINIGQGSVFDLPFKDGWFSLCFTVGVLIHIPPAQLFTAMAEIVRCSGKYVLCAEYWAKEQKERPFLNLLGVTWERPYDELYIDWFKLKLVESGELTKEQGFNELRYFLFKK
jgi:pseudaminic acid biosynthesis-associated methylase